MHQRCTSLLAALIILAAVAPAVADSAREKDANQRFLRLRRDADDQPLALETPIVHYVPREDDRQGVCVDLVGAIHVGDKAYYDQLNKLFAEYDVVLYELVAAEEARVPTSDHQRQNLLTSAQMLMKRMLDLEFQLDCIDYSQKNFVHADLSPTEFKRRMKQRGESFAQMFLRMFGDSFAAQSKRPFAPGETAFLAALVSKDRAYQLKRLLARQFEDNIALPSSLDGPEGSTIISERNKRALDVLTKQLRSGKKRIAIFYGAAHLRDMAQRLDTEFKLKRTETDWITAWDLTSASSKQPGETAPANRTDTDPF